MTQFRPDALAFLTGSLTQDPWPGGISLPGQGGKFTTDGAVQIWQGNTFICHVDVQSRAHDALRALQEEIKMSRFAPFFALLPPSSFHMTVFEGISPGQSDKAYMPHGATAGMTRDELSACILEAVSDLTFASSRSVKMTDLFCANSLTVSPAGEQGEKSLRDIREVLRTATGIHPTRFDEYTFHITLGYLREWLTEPTARALIDFSNELADRYSEKLSAIELGAVEFCNFETMHHFEPLKRLV